jgi:hypothetical protein
MQVEFGAKSHPAFLRRDIRFALSIAVEREALSNLLNGGAAPRRSTLGMTRRFGSRHAVGIAAERCEGLSAIRLAYCDYYPNLRVAEFLRDTWAEALDLSIELVRVPFGAISAAEADLRLELRYLTFPDPIAELESAMAMLARVGSPEERKRAKDLAVQLHYGPENSADSCLAELVHLLDDSVAVIPLLDLSHHCLISSRVSGFNLPHLGNLDYRSLRLETD